MHNKSIDRTFSNMIRWWHWKQIRKRNCSITLHFWGNYS